MSQILPGTDDAELLTRHLTGDPDAFGELFRRHKDRMWAVAVRTVGDRELAADCVQEAFLSAFRRADSYRGQAAVGTWLHRIVVNACLDRLRRERTALRGARPLLDIDLADRRDRYAGVDLALDIHEALLRLPEGQRAALILCDMHGIPVAEAAEMLRVPPGTIKSRCARGRVALAALLRPEPRSGEPRGGP